IVEKAHCRTEGIDEQGLGAIRDRAGIVLINAWPREQTCNRSSSSDFLHDIKAVIEEFGCSTVYGLSYTPTKGIVLKTGCNPISIDRDELIARIVNIITNPIASEVPVGIITETRRLLLSKLIGRVIGEDRHWLRYGGADETPLDPNAVSGSVILINQIS